LFETWYDDFSDRHIELTFEDFLGKEEAEITIMEIISDCAFIQPLDPELMAIRSMARPNNRSFQDALRNAEFHSCSTRTRHGYFGCYVGLTYVAVNTCLIT
jgi:hypothetical protein